MGRPKSDTRRSSHSFHLAQDTVDRITELASDRRFNPAGLSVARMIETFLTSLLTGNLYFDSTGSLQFRGGMPAAPVPPSVPVTRFETPYVAQPAPPPMPFTPQNHDVVDLSPPETYKEINARRLNFVRWLLETVGRTVDASKITPAALNSTSTTFFLPDHPLAKSWDPDGPVGDSQKERAKRVLDAGHFNAYLETTVNDLLAVCDHRQV